MPSQTALLLSAGVAALVVQAARAETVQLLPVADATLIEPRSDDPTQFALGASPYLFAGRVGANGEGTRRRAVMRFDLSEIPSGSTVVSATLEVTMNQAVSTTQPFELHRLDESWSEGPSFGTGGSGVPAVAGDVTWNFRNFDQLAWAVPGGTMQAQPSASVQIGDPGAYAFASTAALVADVQGWLATPSSNHGWAMLGNEAEVGTAKRFDSREGPLPAHPPRLVVEFTPPAPLVGDLDGNGLVNGADLGILLGGWGQPGPSDLNGDGTTNGADLGLLLGHWTV